MAWVYLVIWKLEVSIDNTTVTTVGKLLCIETRDSQCRFHHYTALRALFTRTAMKIPVVSLTIQLLWLQQLLLQTPLESKIPLMDLRKYH